MTDTRSYVLSGILIPIIKKVSSIQTVTYYTLKCIIATDKATIDINVVIIKPQNQLIFHIFLLYVI